MIDLFPEQIKGVNYKVVVSKGKIYNYYVREFICGPFVNQRGGRLHECSLYPIGQEETNNN